MKSFYPYNIPPVACPVPAIAQELDPWRVLEFFRVEALLRSQKVMDLYRAKEADEQFRSRYKVEKGWEVLKGAHHVYLSLDDPRDRVFGQMRIGPGVFDVGGMARWDPIGKGDPGFEMASQWLKAERKNQQFLWLRIDLSLPPDTIVKTLRTQLKEQHRASASPIQKPALLSEILPVPRDSEPVTIYSLHPRKRPLIYGYRGVRTWLDYLRCYDLRVSDEMTFGQIAKNVYGSGGRKTYERAEIGYKRMRQLIQAAECNNWPPTN